MRKTALGVTVGNRGFFPDHTRWIPLAVLAWSRSLSFRACSDISEKTDMSITWR